MRVIKVKPMEEPEVKDIENDLGVLQSEVGGYIQCVYPFDEPVGIVCNDEGKLMGLPLNRSLRDENGEMYDIIAGNFLIVGLTEDDFGSLTDEQVEKYSNMYKDIEVFFRDEPANEHCKATRNEWDYDRR